jgi:hypothetical protein
MASELVRVSGHIIDSLILPKILDEIMDLNGTFEIMRLEVGTRKADPSVAQLRISAASPARLAVILKRLSRLGAESMHPTDARLVRAAKPGVFP